MPVSTIACEDKADFDRSLSMKSANKKASITEAFYRSTGGIISFGTGIRSLIIQMSAIRPGIKTFGRPLTAPLYLVWKQITNTGTGKMPLIIVACLK